MHELDAAQRDLLAAMTQSRDNRPPSDPPAVWALEDSIVNAGHCSATIDGAIAADLMVRWSIHGVLTYLVLTPWGAWLARVVIRERWVEQTIETEDGPKIEHYEVPHWVDRPVDEKGNALVILGNSLQRRFSNECALPFPERVPDRSAGPEYLADPETGEATRDERKALRLFAGNGKPGVPVAIDPRIKGKKPPKAKGRRKRRQA